MQRNLKTFCFWLLLVFMSLVLFNQAARKAFWFDEIVTLRIAQCHFGPEMWSVSTAGFDFTPPAIFVATRLSEMTLGRGPISSRLPSILSGLVVVFCIFQVSSYRRDAAAGFGAVFLLFVSGAFWFFTEARAYALMMAGVMIAWLSWQRRVSDASHRPLQLLGIFLGLTLALASHLWAIVVPGCFVASALARRISNSNGNKALDLGALGAMLAPGAVALSYLPLVAASRQIQFNAVYSLPLYFAYLRPMTYMPHLLLASILIFLVSSSLFSINPGKNFQPKNALPLEDIVLSLSLVCAPAVIYTITRLMHTAFQIRYSLVAALGLAVLSAQVFSFWAQRARIACYATLFVLGMGVSAYGIGLVAGDWHVQPLGYQLSLISQIGGNDEPVVYGSGTAFLQEDYYATPEMAGRLVYVADRQLARQISGTDVVDAGFTNGRDYLGLRGRILSYKELESTYQSFWLIGDSSDGINWISRKLRADGADIRAFVQDARIFHVTLPSRAGE